MWSLWFPSYFEDSSSLQPRNYCQPSEEGRNPGQPMYIFFSLGTVTWVFKDQPAELCLEFPNIVFAEMWVGFYIATNLSSAVQLASVLEPQK